MRKLLFIFCQLLLTATIFAQHTMPGNSGPASGTGGIFGKVTDSTGKPISDASVIILKMKFDPAAQTYKGSLLKGVTTKVNGEFSLEDIPFAQPFQLKISATGFKANTQFISLKQGDLVKDLGKIKLVNDIQQLQDVNVNSTQKLLKMDIDKLSFNVEKNMITTGGTALDIMKYIPAVQTDIDGNVKLRNAAPQIFIDGRPTTLSLDQIPADAIETVEVITNPSAKYDASGGNAGILNIVLKKNRKTGYNANLRAGVDRRGALNGGGDANIRQGKINVSAAFNATQFKNFTDGTTFQFNGFVLPHQQVNQENSTKANGGVLFGKLGFDYFASNRTTVSLNVIRAKWQFKPTDIINSDIVAGGVRNYAYRLSNSKRSFSPTGLQFGMKHLFPKEGREITADATYFSGKNSINSTFYTDSMNASRSVYLNELQKVNSLGENKFLTMQTDYVTPMGKKSKLETGLRVSIRELQNANETSISTNNASYIKVPNAGSNYKNEDNVYAAYAVFSSSMNNIGYQLGLRGESSDYTGTVLTTGDKFKYKYPLSLFPSVFLSRKIKNNQQFQLNYTRRINRPNFFNVIPFIDRTDPLNYSRGNPQIKPEFTQSFGASYNKTFKNNNSLLLSAYYKNTDDLITRFQQKEFDAVAGKEILINTYMNAVGSYNYGFEFTSITALKKWWDLTANINTYNSAINTSNITTEPQDALWSWFGKLNNTFKLPKSYTIQLSANYQSKTNLPVSTCGGGHFAQTQTAAQGYIKAFYGVDLSFRKIYLKNNAASVTLGFSDIFKSRWQHQHSENSYFIQDYSRLRDPQMVRLNFSYRFGKADMSLFKRKNMKAEGEGMQGATQGAAQ